MDIVRYGSQSVLGQEVKSQSKGHESIIEYLVIRSVVVEGKIRRLHVRVVHSFVSNLSVHLPDISTETYTLDQYTDGRYIEATLTILFGKYRTYRGIRLKE